MFPPVPFLLSRFCTFIYLKTRRTAMTSHTKPFSVHSVEPKTYTSLLTEGAAQNCAQPHFEPIGVDTSHLVSLESGKRFE